MKRTKFIITYENDQYKLQRYLNEQSARGWHAEKVGSYHITFSYNEDTRYYYHITLKEEALGFLSGVPQNKKYQDFVEDFDIEVVSTSMLFTTLRSEEPIDYFTDPSVDELQRKRISNKIFRRSLIYLVTIATMAYNMVSIGLYPVLTNNTFQMAIVSFLFFTVFAFNQIYKSWQLKNNKIDDSLTFRWRAIIIDPLTLSIFIFVVWAVVIILPINSLHIVAILIIGLLLHTFIGKTSLTKIQKYGAFALSMILGFMMVNYFIGSLLMNSSHEHIISESWIAVEDYHFDESEELTISLQIKVDDFRDYLVGEFYHRHNIHEMFMRNKKTETQASDGMTYYVYESDDFVVISTEQKSDAYYASFRGQD